MAFWLIVLVLLIIAAALLLVPVLRQPQRDLPEDRDRLNTRFTISVCKSLSKTKSRAWWLSVR